MPAIRSEAYLTARMRTADLRDLALRLREARIDGMRAELAATLVDGAPCPVCGSLDHPELCELRGDRVTREQEEAADADAAAAADRAEMTGAKLAAADILVKDLTERLQDAGVDVPADLAGLQATGRPGRDRREPQGRIGPPGQERHPRDRPPGHARHPGRGPRRRRQAPRRADRAA